MILILQHCIYVKEKGFVFVGSHPYMQKLNIFFEIAASIALIYSLLHRLLQQCFNQFAESENTSTPKIQNMHF